MDMEGNRAEEATVEDRVVGTVMMSLVMVDTAGEVTTESRVDHTKAGEEEEEEDTELSQEKKARMQWMFQ